jgi:hypothetical protein
MIHSNISPTRYTEVPSYSYQHTVVEPFRHSHHTFHSPDRNIVANPNEYHPHIPSTRYPDYVEVSPPKTSPLKTPLRYFPLSSPEIEVDRVREEHLRLQRWAEEDRQRRARWAEEDRERLARWAKEDEDRARRMEGERLRREQDDAERERRWQMEQERREREKAIRDQEDRQRLERERREKEDREERLRRNREDTKKTLTQPKDDKIEEGKVYDKMIKNNHKQPIGNAGPKIETAAIHEEVKKPVKPKKKKQKSRE